MAAIVADRAVLYAFKVEGGKPWYLLLRRADAEVWESVVGVPRDGEPLARAAVRGLVETTALDPLALWGIEHVEASYDAQSETVRLMPCFVAMVSGEVRLGNAHDASRWFSGSEAANAVRSEPRRTSLEAIHREVGQLVAHGSEPDPRLRIV